MVAELIVQHFMVLASNFTIGSALFGTAPLEPFHIAMCWTFAVLTLVVNVIAKKLPIEHFKFT